MSSELKNDDSSDSDCFIIQEIKPVARKKRQTTLTDSILNPKGKFQNSSTHVNNKRNKKPINTCREVFSEGRKVNSSGVYNSDIKQEKEKESGTIKLEKSQKPGWTGSSKSESVSKEKIQLSPRISRKRKRFIMGEFAFKSVIHERNVKKPLLKIFDTVEESTKSTIILTNEETSSDVAKYDSVRDNSQLLSFLVKEMIKDETKKHSTLISVSEKEILDKFFNLKESSCRLFVRMLGRKKGWHRVCDIIYKDISDNLENEFEILHKENYMDVNIGDQDLSIQMELLKKPEVLNLCKAFNVPLKFTVSSKKADLINSLIKECQKQKSAMDMFKGKNFSTRLERLKSEVKKYLGMCIRLNNTAFQAFYKILFLSSFPHYHDEEDMRFSNELLMRSQVYKKVIKFPAYKITSTVVFETSSDFEEYKKAVILLDAIEVAVTNKNFEEFFSIFIEVKEEFKKLLKDNEYQKRFLNLKPFLRKFSAGPTYAKILTIGCTNFKKKVDNSEIRSTAELLLSQNLFLPRKRGEWYEVLSKTFKSQKQNNEAAEVVIKGLKDPHVTEVDHLMLQLRGLLLLKIQSSGISDTSIRGTLKELCEATVQEPVSVEIKGKALAENEAGHRCVYIQELENGKRYISVEERALLHYKSNGFPKGYHTEGLIIQSIYFLLFFDIIYGISLEGVFLSPYQEAPLDFNSSSFYESRKEEIDILLSDMSSWNDQEVEAKIRDSYYKNYGTNCLISWNDEFTPELFCELVKCITVPVLVLIMQRFVRNYRQVRAGFPDLTLWNPETNQCKFVEVKSPSDRLSPGQRVWLDFLRSIGLDCEVCNVKNVYGKF